MVSSPKRGHTIAQLQRLKADNWHNPDTGTELSEGEAETHLHALLEHRAQKLTLQKINSTLKQQVRSRNRPMIPKDQVVFRMIHGHVVPFRKETDTWL